MIPTLNQHYGIPDVLSFTLGKGDMPVAHISNDLGNASIALQGAHVLSFQPRGEEELIWMSEDAIFAPKKSLRGGVPVCWPWFGAHKTDASLPAHGYARTVHWEPIASKALDDGSTYICFELDHTMVDEHLQVHPLNVQLHITVGSSLNLELKTKNNGDMPYTLSQAMHTYFKVGDVRQINIQGLDACVFLDKIDNFSRKTQHGNIAMTQEIDRIYLNTPSSVRIQDNSLQRTILIESEHAHSVIIWNPWIETAAKMGDLGKDGYLNMLCVETGNAESNAVTLSTGETHRIRCNYRIEPQ